MASIELRITRVNGDDGWHEVLELVDSTNAPYIAVHFQSCVDPDTSDFLVVPVLEDAIDVLYTSQQVLHDLVETAIANNAVYILEIPDYLYEPARWYEARSVDTSPGSTECIIQLGWFLVTDFMLKSGPLMHPLDGV